MIKKGGEYVSKYTTEVRFICEEASGLLESKGYNDIESIIAKAIPKIFNFNFPIFDENYRSVLETKILKHFYTREIGEETVGLWKLRLNTRLNEIMPYYNKLYKSELLEFNPLYTDNSTRTKKTDYDSNRNENENISDTNSSNRTITNNGTVNNTTSNNGKVNTTNNSTTTGTGSGTSNNTSTDLYSDTPQGSLSGIESNTYLTNARKVTDNGSTTSKTSNTNSSTENGESSESGTNNTITSDNGTDNRSSTYGRIRGNTDALSSTEDYIETFVGYEGTSASDLLLKFRETFLNIDMLIVNDLEDLFIQLW